LDWTSKPLKRPFLSHLQGKKDPIRCFEYIQLFMTDKPSKIRKDYQWVHDLVQHGLMQNSLRDEIYLLVCKQLTKNPTSKYVTQKLQLICLRGARGKPLTQLEMDRAIEAPFKPSVFGEPLSLVMSLQHDNPMKIPVVLTFLTHAIIQLKGYETEGIFRVPGDTDEVNELSWLRDLPDPLVPNQYYDLFLQHSQNLTQLIQVVQELPDCNRRILLYLIHFIQGFLNPPVVEMTLMNLYNLSMVLAPTFLRCPHQQLNMVFMCSHLEQVCLKNWLTYFIVHPHSCLLGVHATVTLNSAVDLPLNPSFIESSNGFTVEYFNYYKIITNLVSLKTYCVVLPGVRETPADCTSTSMVLSTAKKMAVMGDIHEVIPFIELLGIHEDMTHIENNQLVSSPCSFNKSNSPETADIFFSNQQEGLNGIKYKASWLLYLAAFFDKEYAALSIYTQIVDRYECHKYNVGSTTIHRNIAWTSFDPLLQSYTIHNETYYQQLSEDAALHFVRPNTGSKTVYQATMDTDLQVLANQLQSTQYIVDTSDISVNYTTWFSTARQAFNPVSDIEKKLYKVSPAFDVGHVYSVQGLIGSTQSGK
ncbi:hypothetical protein BDB01DRAFT_716850, partial [Pilobolus umbonatus]